LFSGIQLFLQKIIEVLRVTNLQIQDTRLQFGANRTKTAATIEMKRPLSSGRSFFAGKLRV
jgi:hypothetical protein